MARRWDVDDMIDAGMINPANKTISRGLVDELDLVKLDPAAGPEQHLAPGWTFQPAVDPLAAERQARQAIAQALRASMPWIPAPLLDIFITEWIEAGNTDLAWAKVRQDSLYDQFFPGNKRDDGSVRYVEQEYLSIREGFDDVWRDFGLTPDRFQGRYTDLFAGSVSPQELRDRVQARADFVDQSSATAKTWYEQQFGWSPTREAMLATAIDSEQTEGEFRRGLQGAHVGGAGLQFGFDRSGQRVDALMRQGLDTRDEAQQFFAQAAQRVPQLDVFASRFGDPQGQFGIEAFEQAGVFGDPLQQLRARRLQGRERSQFSPMGGVAADQTGAVIGLRRR